MIYGPRKGHSILTVSICVLKSDVLKLDGGGIIWGGASKKVFVGDYNEKSL